MHIVATGGNYVIAHDKSVAVCRVWKRPDVGREEGARFAQQKVEHSRALASGSALVARGLVLDMRDAPASWGPATHAALVQFIECWETADRHVAVLVGDEPLQRIMARDVLKDAAPRRGKMCRTPAEVDTWLGATTMPLLQAVATAVAENHGT